MTQKTTNAITSLSFANAQQSDQQNSMCICSQSLAQAELEQYLEQQAAEIAPFIIHADQLTRGNVIKCLTGDIWQVVSEPEYTQQGICFDVMWLDVGVSNNVQGVCFAPTAEFELVSHQLHNHHITESQEKMTSPCFVHAQIHSKQLIGIVFDRTGFTFQILTPGSVEEAGAYYPDQETALAAAVEQVEKNARWLAGFEAYERGESLPEIADLDFISGWHEGQQAHERAA